MKFFTTAMLLAVMVSARGRRQQPKMSGTDDENVDIKKVVGMTGVPSGLIATEDKAD